MTPSIKQDWLKRAKDHTEADRFIKGEWLNGMVGEYKSGCFIGCMTQSESDAIELAAEQMNSPLWLIYLSERIFEGLPDGEAEKFPVQYIEAIPESVDSYQYETLLHRVGFLRMQRLLKIVEEIETEESYKQECLDAINLVSEYHLDPSAAWSAAESAARSVSQSARLAESASQSAWSASESARSAAESAEYINERDDLFKAFSQI